jgi:hypothetical protein
MGPQMVVAEFDGVPLNVTVPGLVPKFAPLIATDVPNTPETGLTLLINGVCVIVNCTPGLATPPAA